MEHLLTQNRWIDGPDILGKTVEKWPVNKLDIVDGDPEVKRDLVVNAGVVNDISNTIHQLMMYFSDWKKIKSSVAWFLKLGRTLLELSRKRKHLLENAHGDTQAKVEHEMQQLRITLVGQRLSVDDLKEVETAIIRFTQQESFPR